MITKNFFSNTDDDLPLPDWISKPGATPPPKPQPKPEEPASDEPLPDWLSGSAAPKPTWDEGDLKGWSPEMIQRDAEKRAYKDEIPELEDIPEDMPLPDLEDLTSSTGSSGDDSYVPDWYMGLEEQNLDTAPDWFKSTGQIKDSSSLLDISGLEPPKPPSRLEQAKPASTPLAMPSLGDDVPDWFSGANAAPEQPSLDWLSEPTHEEMPMPSLQLDDEDEEIDYASDVLADLDLDDEDEFEEIDYASDVLAELGLDDANEGFAQPEFDFDAATRDFQTSQGYDDLPELDFGDAKFVEPDFAEPEFDFGKPDNPAMSFQAPKVDFADFQPPKPAAVEPPKSVAPSAPAADLSWLDEIESGIEADKQPAAEAGSDFDFAEIDTPSRDFSFDLEADAEPDFFAEEGIAGEAGGGFDFNFGTDNADLDFEAGKDPDFDFGEMVEDDAFASIDFGSRSSQVPPSKAEPALADLLGDLKQDFGDNEEMPWMQHLREERSAPQESSGEFNFDVGAVAADDVFGLFPDDDFGAAVDEDKPYKPMTAPIGGTSNLISHAKTSSMDLGSLLDDLGELPDVPVKQTSSIAPDASALSEDELFGDMGDSFFESFNKAKGTESLEHGGPTLDIADADFDFGDIEPSPEPDVLRAEKRPDWIADLRPDDIPIKLKAGAVEFELEQAKITDMSDDLRKLREKSAKITAGFQAPQQAPASGPLAGIAGGLTAAELMQAVAPAELQFGNEVRVPNEQVGRIKLLESALEGIRHEQATRREGKTRALPEVKKISTRPRFKVDRLLVSLLLLAVLIVPFITDAAHLDLFDAPDTNGLTKDHQLAVSEAIDGIEAGQYVLVAFDYDATTAHELNPLAEAVLADIIKQGGIPILTSTSPIGTLNARSVTEAMGLTARRDYIALRYIPGEAVGVRTLIRSEEFTDLQFSFDTDGKETNLELGILDSEDFAFVVVIGAGFEDARRWAEQFQLPNEQKYLLTTAAAEALVQGYVGNSQAYQGYLAGYQDTMRYNATRNPERITTAENLDDYNLPNTDVGQWYSTSLGVMVVVGFMVLGFVFNLILRGRKRK